jgi:hypothetical protein
VIGGSNAQTASVATRVDTFRDTKPLESVTKSWKIWNSPTRQKRKNPAENADFPFGVTGYESAALTD